MIKAKMKKKDFQHEVKNNRKRPKTKNPNSYML